MVVHELEAKAHACLLRRLCVSLAWVKADRWTDRIRVTIIVSSCFRNGAVSSLWKKVVCRSFKWFTSDAVSSVSVSCAYIARILVEAAFTCPKHIVFNRMRAQAEREMGVCLEHLHAACLHRSAMLYKR